MFRLFIFCAVCASFQLNAGDLSKQFSALLEPRKPDIEITAKLIGEYFLKEAQANMGTRKKVSIIKFRVNEPYHQMGKSQIDARIWEFLCSVAAGSPGSRIKESQREAIFEELENLTGVEWSIAYMRDLYNSGREQENSVWLEIKGHL